MKTMRQLILDRIGRRGAGKAFMAKDFLDIASRGTIDMTFSALIRDGSIRRIRRGLYDSPQINPALGGALSPDIDEAARALARRYRWKIIPDGTLAANILGLSTQVPAKIVYLSDGPNKKIELGRRVIHFKHARPQTFIGDDGKSALVVQALRSLGKENVDQNVISRLRNVLSDFEQRRLVKVTQFGVDWIHQAAKTIAGEAT